MRKETAWSTESKMKLLDQLPAAKNDPAAYQRVMYQIGRALGEDLVGRYRSPNSGALIACTVEDADFLARGILDQMEAANAFKEVHLACFWNDRYSFNTVGVEVAPILKRYFEPTTAEQQVLMIVKSVVSGTCVVKTNLTSVIERFEPDRVRVVVVAPMMLDGAEDRLAREFPPTIASKFEYLSYATETEKDERGLVEGLGGDVYDLLGFGSREEKNRYVPEIVRTRRERYAAV